MSNHEIQFNQVAKMFEGTNEGLFVMDSDYNVKYYNMNFYNPFSIDSMKNNTCTIDEWIDRIHDMDRSRMRNSYKDFLSGSDGEYFEGVYRVYLKSKEVCWIQSRAMMIHHEDESWSVIGVHKDISKEKHLDHMLYDFNYVDDLTGLLNQSKLEKVLAEIISKSEKYMLIYININEFKFINEAYGEEAGDRVLIRVAETLKHNAKISNMIFRIHGDEFVLLMNNDMSNEEIYGFINLLKEDIQKRFYIKRKLIGIKVSVGVCQLPMELKTPLSVIQRAKWTMNYAKRKTHSMVAMFDEEIDRCILKRMYIQAEMKSAMDNGEFYLKFQPVMDIKQKKIKTFEALIRWNSSGWGEIFPDEFINIAEENGDITELGQFVLEESCKFVKKFKEEYNKDIRVSVNVSVVQLMERQYVSNFLNTIKRENIPAESIIIEVTESHMLEGSNTMIKKLKILRRMGIEIALDDFGTGYSSLNSLLLLPLSYVKIDRIVMDRIMDRNEVGRFIRSVITLCGDMDLEVVCEGIETLDMVERARIIGAKYLQGYHFARPLMEDKAIEYLLQLYSDNE